MTIGVHDPMFPTNTGRWTISADGAERSDEPADVEVDIGTLSAAYLGAVSWHDLAVDRCRHDAPDRAGRTSTRCSRCARPRSAAPATDPTRPAMSDDASGRFAHRRSIGDQGPEKMPSLMSSWRDMYSAFGS